MGIKNNKHVDKAAKKLISIPGIQLQYSTQTTTQLFRKLETSNGKGSGKPVLISYTISNPVFNSAIAAKDNLRSNLSNLCIGHNIGSKKHITKNKELKKLNKKKVK